MANFLTKSASAIMAMIGLNDNSGIVVHEHAKPAAANAVNRIKAHMSELPDQTPARAGEKRAAARLKAQAKANKKLHDKIDHIIKARGPSRQQQRRKDRYTAKSRLHQLKLQAMRQKVPGGAAGVRQIA